MALDVALLRLDTEFRPADGQGSDVANEGEPPNASHNVLDLSVLDRLLTSLALEDAEAVLGSQKGKGKAGDALPDEELAFALFAQELADRQLAFSFQSALGTDADILQRLAAEEALAARDRAMAEALQRGDPFPRSQPATRPASTAGSPVTSRPSTRATSPLHSPGASTVTSRRNSFALPSLGQTSSKISASSSSTAYIAKKPFSAGPSGSGKAEDREECCICMSPIYGALFTTTCGHNYDVGCLADLVRSSMTDQTLFPPRCCKQAIPLDSIRGLLSVQLVRQFESKAVELSTIDRLYCPRPTCSLFLGPASAQPKQVICPRCSTVACAACKNAHGASGACPTNEGEPLAELARSERWQRCPGCRRLVELETGCYHMTCACRTEFCYVCAARWKTCACEQWDEGRLIARAQHQVANELGHRFQPAAPAVQERVRAAAERLRHNHDCQHTYVNFRRGARQCETCHWNADQFLLECRECHTFICKRCRLNRF